MTDVEQFISCIDIRFIHVCNTRKSVKMDVRAYVCVCAFECVSFIFVGVPFSFSFSSSLFFCCATSTIEITCRCSTEKAHLKSLTQQLYFSKRLHRTAFRNVRLCPLSNLSFLSKNLKSYDNYDVTSKDIVKMMIHVNSHYNNTI